MRPGLDCRATRRNAPLLHVDLAAKEVDAAEILALLPDHTAAGVGGDEGRGGEIRITNLVAAELEGAAAIDHDRGGTEIATGAVVFDAHLTGIDRNGAGKTIV